MVGSDNNFVQSLNHSLQQIAEATMPASAVVAGTFMTYQLVLRGQPSHGLAPMVLRVIRTSKISRESFVACRRVVRTAKYVAQFVVYHREMAWRIGFNSVGTMIFVRMACASECCAPPSALARPATS